MTISLSEQCQVQIIGLCKKLREVTTLKIREVASTIGTLVSPLPAVPHGALHYRALEHAKNAALQSQNGNFNKKMSIPPDAICDILWWEQNVTGSFSPIHRDPVHRCSLAEDYRKCLPNSSPMPGEMAPKNSIIPLYEDGETYCGKRQIDPLTPPVSAVINFLTSLFEMGMGYGSIASA